MSRLELPGGLVLSSEIGIVDSLRSFLGAPARGRTETIDSLVSLDSFFALYLSCLSHRLYEPRGEGSLEEG